MLLQSVDQWCGKISIYCVLLGYYYQPIVVSLKIYLRGRSNLREFMFSAVISFKVTCDVVEPLNVNIGQLKSVPYVMRRSKCPQ